jgi:type IV/VI secretion system ImpK/VasF family protein
MSPSVQRSFLPVFEVLTSLATGKVSSPAELRPLRVELRKQLGALKSELTARVGERESYSMLFALVVHLDEIVRTGFPDADHTTWPLLQQELFDTDRGGQLFYQSLEEMGNASEVAQVYYFCLNLGFHGKYAQEPERRAQIMSQLRERLLATPSSALRPIDLAAEAPPVRVPPIRSRAWPYAIAAAAVVALHLLLSGLAASTAAGWREADRAATSPSGRKVEMAGAAAHARLSGG